MKICALTTVEVDAARARCDDDDERASGDTAPFHTDTGMSASGQ